jgi:hypothetical protein
MDPHDRARLFAALDRNQAIALEPEIAERILRIYGELESLLPQLRARGIEDPGQIVVGIVTAAIVAEDRGSRQDREEP